MSTADPRTLATRDAILDAALVVFARDGVRGSRVEDVAVEAGVSRQSVYYHYRSREELLAALLERGIAGLAAAVDEPDSGDSIDGFVTATVEFFAANQTLCRLLITEMWGLPGDPEGPRRIIDRIEDEIVAPLAARIRAARDGNEETDPDPTFAARALMGQVAGVALGQIVREGRFEPDEVRPRLVAYARAVLGADRKDPS